MTKKENKKRLKKEKVKILGFDSSDPDMPMLVFQKSGDTGDSYTKVSIDQLFDDFSSPKRVK